MHSMRGYLVHNLWVLGGEICERYSTVVTHSVTVARDICVELALLPGQAPCSPQLFSTGFLAKLPLKNTSLYPPSTVPIITLMNYKKERNY